jgi:hypothetical protein
MHVSAQGALWHWQELGLCVTLQRCEVRMRQKWVLCSHQPLIPKSWPKRKRGKLGSRVSRTALMKCQLVIYSGSVPVRFEHDWHLSGPVCIGINWSAQKTPGTGLALQLLATWHIWKSETHTHHRRHWQSSCCQSGCIGPTPHGPPGLASRHHTRYPTALDEKQSHALVLV